MAIERSDAKFTRLPINQYDGCARLGELVVDVNTDPQYPSLYLGNVTHNLNFIAKPFGGLNPGGNATVPNAGPNTNMVGALVVGDIKHSLLTVDHSGWVKLDGRAVSTLTPNQQTVAIALGYPTNLPNATGRVLKQTGTTPGTTGGGTQVTLVERNIPFMNGNFVTNNMFRKEVIAAVGDPITDPNMIDIKPGNTTVVLSGQVNVGYMFPDPVNIPEQPYVSVSTFIFLGP